MQNLRQHARQGSIRRHRYSERGSSSGRKRFSKRPCGRGGQERDADMKGPSQRLEPRLSQALIMTPQLQQAIKMLQLSNLELTDFIDREIQQNPLLERRERQPPENALGHDVSPAESGSLTAAPEMLTGEFTPDAPEHWQPQWGEDGDGPVDFGGEPQTWRNHNGSFDPDGPLGLDQTATRQRTLREHLLEQIGTDLGDQGDW